MEFESSRSSLQLELSRNVKETLSQLLTHSYTQKKDRRHEGEKDRRLYL